MDNYIARKKAERYLNAYCKPPIFTARTVQTSHTVPKRRRRRVSRTRTHRKLRCKKNELKKRRRRQLQTAQSDRVFDYSSNGFESPAIPNSHSVKIHRAPAALIPRRYNYDHDREVTLSGTA